MALRRIAKRQHIIDLLDQRHSHELHRRSVRIPARPVSVQPEKNDITEPFGAAGVHSCLLFCSSIPASFFLPLKAIRLKLLCRSMDVDNFAHLRGQGAK